MKIRIKWVKMAKLVAIYTSIFLVILWICFYFTKLPFDNLHYHEMGYAVFDNKKELIGLYTNIHGNNYIPYEGEIALAICNGLLAVEDQRFFHHHGVDFKAIVRACLQNIFSGKRVSGASTLTMQLVRLKMNYPRNWLSKFKEAWYALKIEQTYSKNEILLAYLNNAPFGSNIYGIETAALSYFSKRANELSIDEVALLLGLPQSPSRLRPDRYFPKANTRKLFILYRMFQEKFISAKEYGVYSHQATKLKVHLNSQLNQIVPQLIKNNGQQGLAYTNIDSLLQNKINDIAVSYQLQLGLEYDCAVTVVEVGTGRVLAISESENKEKADYISSAFCPRSTGSCLKPFIYGKAFEMGLAWPEMMVSDMPESINGYNPRNNDYHHFKKIAVKDALRFSRNIPAVVLLNKIGLEKFNEMMVDLQLLTANQNNHSGLSSALGGLSVNLLNMTNSYGVFAREGSFLPYSLISNSTLQKPKKIFTSPTSAMLKECLIYNEELNFHAKTGTSWGPRDVWCIGYDKNYSIGVWLGLKNGGSMNGVTGEATAYPLLCKIFSLLSVGADIQSKEEGAELIVCNESGNRASRYCTNVRVVRSPHGIIRPSICLQHQKMEPIASLEKKFKIITPVMSASYLMVSSNKDLTIECKSNDITQPIYWFVNGVFKSCATKQYLNANELKSGENIVSSINNKGESDLVKITVKILPGSVGGAPITTE